LRWSYLHCNASFVIYIIESIANEIKKTLALFNQKSAVNKCSTF
jgi:hypothetical protein